MVKRIETVEEFNADGKLIKRTVTEFVDDESKPIIETVPSGPVVVPVPYYPTYPSWAPSPSWRGVEITCKT